MENIDTQVLRDVNDEELFMKHVVCEDAELLYLDSLLGAVLRA